jgi:hypothetical protein
VAQVTDVRRSRSYHALVGIGLVSYGLLHLVVAWIAVQLVLGRRGDASSEGAFRELRQQPLGDVLLWIMAIGLFTLTIWQAVETTIGRDQPSRDGRLRRRLTSAGRAILYYCARRVALGIIGVLFGWAAISYDPEKAGGLDDALATIRDQPFGSVLLMIMAAGLACFGIYCFFWARMARY